MRRRAAASGVWRDAGAAFPGRDRGKSDYGDRGLLLCGAGASPGRMPVQLRAGGAGSRRRTGDSAGRGDAGGAGEQTVHRRQRRTGEMQAEPETDGAPETDDALAGTGGAYNARDAAGGA